MQSFKNVSKFVENFVETSKSVSKVGYLVLEKVLELEFSIQLIV